MSERLTIQTLGGLRIHLSGQLIKGFKTRKAPAMLVYLACTERTQPREVLAELFWSERPRSDALRDLRGVLHNLNQTVGAYVETTHETVGIRAGADIWLDRREFEARLETGQIEVASTLYQGDFLAGFYVDSAAFELWITRERERLRLLAIESLDRLVTSHLAQGNYPAGITVAMRLREMDNLREETYRKLMDLLVRSGQRTQALEQYNRLCTLLEEEFGLTPLPELVTLCEEIRAGIVPGGPAPFEKEPPVIPARPVTLTNPYKGLCAFEEHDADDFFGREALTQRLLARLAEENGQSRFLAVVGASGSGKSSVVRAGLIPALRRGALPGSAGWHIVTFLPGAFPFDELDLALRRTFADAPSTLNDDLGRDERGLLRAARLCLQDSQRELLVVIDQFEEVFTQVSDPTMARRLLDALYFAATSPHSPVRIVITLRADFYDRPLMIPDFSELIRQGTEVVTPMMREELERAIMRPAERVGVTPEPELVTAIVAEVGQQPGALPLMEYALTEVFERRTNHTLTLADYEAVGGALGALARRADEVFMHLSIERQEAARQLCMRLITLGEGTEDTRRRALQAELISAGGEATRAVLHAFGRARLLTFDHDPRTYQPTVELAHEAIMREWRRLRTWLDESRDDVRLQRLLAAAATEWEQAKHDKSYLLTGSRLEQFRDWSEQTEVALTLGEGDFLKASIQEYGWQRTRRRRLRNALLTTAILVAFAMTVLSLIAFDREQQAEREADVNHSLVLANSAQLQFDNGETDLALALALEAVSIDDPPAETIRILSTVALGTGTRAILREQGDKVTAVAFNSTSTLALSGSCEALTKGACSEGELIVWDLETATELRQLEGHTDWVTSLAFSPTDPSIALSASKDGTLLLWNVETGQLIRRFDGHTGSINSVAFSSNGKTALSGSDDMTAILWDVDSGGIIRRFEGLSDRITSVAFSPDQHLAAASGDTADPSIMLWDVETGMVAQRLVGPTARILAVNFRKHEQGLIRVFAVSADDTYREWNIDTGDLVRSVGISSGVPYGMALSPDQRTALECEGNTCLVLDISSWTLVDRIIPPSRQLILSSTINPDGTLALIGTSAGEVILFNLPVSAEVRRFYAEGGLGTVDISSNGRYLLTGGYDNGTVNLWDVQTGQEVRRLEGQEPTVGSVRFSPDGQQALICSSPSFSGRPGGMVVLWDVETGNVIHELAGHEFYPRNSAFSPDGRTALTGTLQWGAAWEEEGVRGELILWDLATGKEIRRFEPTRSILDISFSPDGRRAITANTVYDHVTLWDVATGQRIRQFDPYSRVVAFTPDARYFLTASEGGFILLMDAESGETVRLFTGPSASFWAFDVSPDQKYLLGGGYQGLFTLWNFETGEEIQRFWGHSFSAVVWNIVFSPDGQTAFSSVLEPEGAVIQWRIADRPLHELLSWVRENRYVRAFTCAERAQYRIEPLCP